MYIQDTTNSRSKVAGLFNFFSGNCAAITIVFSIFQLISIEDLSIFYAFTTIIFLLSIIFDARRGGVSFLFALQFVIFIGIPASIQVNGGLFPFFASPALDSMYLGYGLISLSQICFQIGQFIQNKNSGLEGIARIPEYRSITLWAWTLGVVAIFISIYIGPSLMLATRDEVSELVNSSEGIMKQLQFICRSIGLLSFLIILHLSRHSAINYYRKINLIALIIAIPAFLYLYFPPTLPRTYIIGPAIAISAIYWDYRRPIVKLTLSLVALPLLFIVFPAMKALGQGARIGDLISAISMDTIGFYVFRVDFDIYIWTVETIEYVMNGGALRWGYNFFGVVFFFVPRSIWPTKPTHTGEIVSSGMGFIYHNVSSPLWAEAYISFGVLGVIIIMILIGYWVNFLEGRARGPRGQDDVLNFYLYLIAMGFAMIIVRGALNSVASGFATAFIVFFIMSFSIKRKLKWKLR